MAYVLSPLIKSKEKSFEPAIQAAIRQREKRQGQGGMTEDQIPAARGSRGCSTIIFLTSQYRPTADDLADGGMYTVDKYKHAPVLEHAAIVTPGSR